MFKALQKYGDGIKVMGPLLPAAFPFGMITGVTALDAHLSAAAGIGQSIIVFAGAAQLAMLQLMQGHAWPPVIVLTVFIINVRFAMYSASLAPHFSQAHWSARWAIAYLMTDQSYALSIARFAREPDMTLDRKVAYYLGGASLMWFLWILATVLGFVLGAAVPPSWSLEFAVPLGFIAMLIPALRDRPSLAAAFTGGSIAVIAHGLPFNLGLFLGAVCGIGAGYACERHLEARRAQGGQNV
ncbi:MAG: AzlC family ABC transporter permease [Parvibaculum sp.]